MTILRYSLLLPLIALSACVLLSAAARPVPTIATFSVVAYDPATGEVGVAVQSRFFAVGSVVPWAQAGVGAVASQAMGNPTLATDLSAWDTSIHSRVPWPASTCRTSIPMLQPESKSRAFPRPRP